MSCSVSSTHKRARGVPDRISVGIVLMLLAGGWDVRGQEPRTVVPDQAVVEKPSKATTNETTSVNASDVAQSRTHRQSLVQDSDNWTFRPTVLIRRGTSQGSGTIIASLDGDTLILTAAHVIRGHGPILVELHRYNLGLEHLPSSPGRWPRQVPAELAASDTAADIAVVRVRNMVALPFVARLVEGSEPPPLKADLTSVGIDLGAKLSSWKTVLVEVLGFELNDSGTDRPFLVTARIPEHGRSGGGLFDQYGKLVGVCVGHAELIKGKRMGVFSSAENVRELLRQNELTAVIDKSEAAQGKNGPHPAGQPSSYSSFEVAGHSDRGQGPLFRSLSMSRPSGWIIRSGTGLPDKPSSSVTATTPSAP